MDPNTLVPLGVGVAQRPEQTVPRFFAILGNYPNPFNPSTVIRYALPEDGVVTLKVFDILGRSVATRPLGVQTAGIKEVSFDATGLSSGLYLYQLQLASPSGHVSVTRTGKMSVVK